MKMQKNPWRRTLAEKVSFSVSLLIVGIIIALVCYTWLTGDTNPPILSVITTEVKQINRQYYVPFTVRNFGGETANSVEIMAQLFIAPGTTEIGRQQIDYLSRQEERSGEFIFSRDPRQGELTIRVTSYQQP